MITKIGAVTATLAAIAFGTLLPAQHASAGCTPAQASEDLVAWRPASLANGLRPLAFMQTADLANSELSYSDFGDSAPLPSVVGLWQFAFLSKGTPGIPDGAQIDTGYVTWHSDGTELMNSGRAPMTGSFCMGAWKQIGRSTFKLNHFALSWDNSGTVFVGPANIREVITVNRARDHYAGTFTLDQYASDGVTVLAHITGTVTAMRITAD
jgi:hypothetical protein